ncbi:MAG: protein kinase [Planctomycetota bacterium]
MKIHCPECRGIFRVEGRASGTQFECPFCKASFSFRDKETVVATAAPETVVRTETETEEPAPSAADAPPLAKTTASASSDPTRRDTVPTPEPQPPESAPVEATDLTDLRVGDVVNSAYRLDSIIGCGGMSVVFKARQLSLDRDVAVKVLRRDLSKDPEFSQRFLKEAQALAELSHPNIVQVFDQGVFRGNHYLVMEFIDGVSIREVLNERRLTPDEALKLVPQLCNALEYAHSCGIVHRDIKPENLMLTKAGEPKIADFGLVRILGDRSSELSRLTKTQTILGTLEYMAPEQREGQRDIDHRADIYSLGVVFYEMLTGELPIARFPLPSERVQVDVRLDDVVLKVLAKDRDRRYQRASMVATDIANLGTLARAGRSAGTDSRPANSEIGPRLMAMAQSPVFFIFSLAYMLIALGRTDNDFQQFVHGLAIPVYLSQFTLFGLLPRQQLPNQLFLYRHPVVFFGLLCLFTMMLAGGDDVANVFCGIFAGSAVCVWKWRRKIFRQPGEPRYLIPAALSSGAAVRPAPPSPPVPPHKGAPKGEGTLAEDRHRAAPTVPAAMVAAAASAGASSPHESGDDPQEHEQRELVGAGAAAGDSTATAQTDEPKTRLSFLAVLAFLATLLTMVYAGGVLVASRVDWGSVAMYSDLDHRDVAEVLRDGLWAAPGWTLEHGGLLAGAALVVPLIVPVLLSLLALIPLQSPHKRGGMLVGVACIFLLIQWGIVLNVADRIGRTAEEYRRNVEHGGTLVEALRNAEAAPPQASLARLSSLHRAVYLARGGEATPVGGRFTLLDIAKNRLLPPTERIAALVALQDIYGTHLFVDRDGEMLREWVITFSAAAAEARNPLVREAFLEVLSRCTASVPKKLFYDALASSDRRYGRLAVRWWTGAAPLDAIEWLGERYRELPPRTLIRWIDGLERTSNRRFHNEAELRHALLAPLIGCSASEYDCTFDERVSRLITSGPSRWTY